VLYIVARVGARFPELIGMAWRRSASVTGATVTAVGLLLAFQVGVIWPDTFTRFANVGQGETVSAEVHARAVQVGVVVGTGAVFGLYGEIPVAGPAVPVPAGPQPDPGTTAPGSETTVPGGSSTTVPGTDTTAPAPPTTAAPTTTVPPTTTAPPTTAPPTTAPPTTTTTTGPCLTILPIC
jgi:hypothetical protein